MSTEKFKDKIKKLSEQCFCIEHSLELFNFNHPDNDEQYLRRELYKIRCDILSLVRYAEMVDEAREKNEKS